MIKSRSRASEGMVRTNLSIDKEVFEEFAAEADRRKMTLFAFANESLSAITKISQEGGNPDEFYKIWRVLTILRQVDVITLPSDFVDDLIERLFGARGVLGHELDHRPRGNKKERVPAGPTLKPSFHQSDGRL